MGGIKTRKRSLLVTIRNGPEKPEILKKEIAEKLSEITASTLVA